MRGGFWLGTEQESTAEHFTPGAIEGSYVVATKQYRAVISMHKKGGCSYSSSYHTDHEGGTANRDPQGGSSEGTQRGDGRRPGRRPLQKAGGSKGGGRHIKRGRLSRRPLQKQGGSAGGRYRKRAAVTGGLYEKRAAVTGGCPGTGCPNRPPHKQFPEAGRLNNSARAIKLGQIANNRG
jgi:hypothetical protein